jgi:hypothetical protein
MLELRDIMTTSVVALDPDVAIREAMEASSRRPIFRALLPHSPA